MREEPEQGAAEGLAGPEAGGGEASRVVRCVTDVQHEGRDPAAEGDWGGG